MIKREEYRPQQMDRIKRKLVFMEEEAMLKPHLVKEKFVKEYEKLVDILYLKEFLPEERSQYFEQEKFENSIVLLPIGIPNTSQRTKIKIY